MKPLELRRREKFARRKKRKSDLATKRGRRVSRGLLDSTINHMNWVSSMSNEALNLLNKLRSVPIIRPTTWNTNR